MPEVFHFQQPAWFLALLPLAALIWWLRRHAPGESSWRRVCDPRLLSYLLIEARGGDRGLPLGLLVTGWLIAVIALADPVWEKRPQPVFSSEEARVVVLDLSRSMNDADLKPSRLERARYKVEDVLRRSREGQVGLVAYAGDAFVVSPLTSDAHTITEMLKTLEPGLMPVQGSRADRGLLKAGELLAQAGDTHGEILLVTDGYQGQEAPAAARKLRKEGYTLSVLGVGTAEGAPLADGAGGFVHDATGAIVVPRLDAGSLRDLANAGGGRYATITGNDADINTLLTPLTPRLDSKIKQTGLETDAWQSRGPWLAVLLLPLGALAFRRGWLLGVVLLVAATSMSPQPARASTWDDLWTRRDQQAAEALAAGDHARAASLATDPERRGTAQYRAGQYEAALADFRKGKGPDAEYNQGNALARLGRYQDAIAAYDKALAVEPGMADAQHNKEVIQKLLQQQKQQQQNQQAGQGQKQDQQQQSSARNSSGNKGKEKKSAGSSGQQGSQPQNSGGKESTASQASKTGQEQAKSSSGSTGEQQNASRTKGNGEAQNQPQQPGSQPRDEKSANGAGQMAQWDKQEQSKGQSATRESKTQSQAAAGRQSDETAQPKREQAANRSAGTGEPTDQPGAAGMQAGNEPPPTEEQQATEQWLRRIPDDPGGLLRRKFLYQYRQRAAGVDDSGQDW